MYKKVLFAIISIAILSLTPYRAFPMGRSEDPIRQARELVARNRINEAILLLEQTVREDPERIQQAEALLRTIRDIRGEYNVLFDQLIDNLVNNPDDIERTLEIIEQMERLDEFPNQRVVEQIEDARIVAQLAYDRNLLDQRMDEARSLLAEGDYEGAVDIYVGLRELQRDRFESRGYGDIFVNTVDSAVAEVPTLADDFLERLDPYQQRGEAVQLAAAGDLTGVEGDTLELFFAEATEMTEILTRVSRLSGEMAVIRSQVPLQFPNDPVDWYLNFQETILRGRQSLRGEEGLAFAVEQAYLDSMVPLVEAGQNRTLELLAQGNSASMEDRYDEATRFYGEAGQNGILWEQAEGARAGLFDLTGDISTVVEGLPPDDAGAVVTARGTTEVARSREDLADTMALFIETGEDREDTLFSLESQKDSVNGIVLSLQNSEAEWLSFRGAVEELPAESVEPVLEERLQGVDNAWAEGLQRAIARERSLVSRIAALRTEEVPQDIQGYTEELETTAPLNEGVPVSIGDGEDAVQISRYPDEALENYRSVLDDATADLTVVTDALETVRSEPEYLREGDEVAAAETRLVGLVEDLEDIIQRARTGVNRSEELIARSESLIDEALERTADMRAAIDAMQVDAARNNFNAVREAYFESLELREDPEFRDVVDLRIQDLGDELQELENVIVVQRVRELLNQANNLYNQDEFVAARDTLLEAQQTWEQTNVTANSEIDRLLRLVTAALSLEEGRELALTDPLYPILSNYLSIAREDYNRAVSLYDDGRETQAEPLFDRAVENLRNVRDVRPLNWDARILELRISQIRNADDFESVFEARYEQALDRLDSDGPLEVYSELEVLAEINPDYPGIQEQIRRLEISLNLRPDPVDEARRREASALFQRAQGLGSGSRDQAIVAVSLLEEAVELDPTNNQAATLLDQLRIRLGGQATVTLTTSDEQQYRRAETLFSQGQALQAFSIVERLLQDTENRNYPPLVDLRRRIALRLGI
jgi:hypothetical protein